MNDTDPDTSELAECFDQAIDRQCENDFCRLKRNDYRRNVVLVAKAAPVDG
jgi:hypothetical protein